MSDLDIHVGERIRLYRKNKNMTIKDLADKIHKGRPAVSKYENGNISLDVNTLMDIANALGIHVSQLLDFDQMIEKSPYSLSDGFFGKNRFFYLYYIDGKKHEIYRSLIEIDRENDIPSALFYVRIKDFNNIHDCAHLYFGNIYITDTYFHMVMQNQMNQSEKIFLNLLNPFHQGNEAVGILSGISTKNMLPVSYKVLVSKNRLLENDELREKLLLSKEELKNIKLYNTFSIDTSTIF